MSSASRTLLVGIGLLIGAVAWLRAEPVTAPRPRLAGAHAPAASAAGPIQAVAAQVAPRVVGAPPRPARTTQAAPSPGERASVDRAVLDKYCVTCHSERLKRGGLVLEGIDVADVGAHADVWEKVVRKMRGSEMPPNGSPRPEPVVYKSFPASVEAALDRASAQKPNAGRVALHRLNRTEYANAVRDVLALEIDGPALLPIDETGYGFDNIAGVLSMSPGLLERYKLAAWKISRLAVGDRLLTAT